jgi:hypothetical protein
LPKGVKQDRKLGFDMAKRLWDISKIALVIIEAFPDTGSEINKLDNTGGNADNG